ncbi:hypothetical protein ACIQ9P_32290 [Kitasatospora sp. NPDC094019]|uniref:hypothetical protein n=1 Tax=Kitasatospora sp. NPDC094019 TaxID=3364091 RepID=UPI0038232861
MPERPSSTLQDLIAHTGFLLVIPAFALRLLSRHGDQPVAYLTTSWILQGLALLAVLAGMTVAVTRSTRPSPGMWGLLVLWTFGTALALLNAVA